MLVAYIIIIVGTVRSTVHVPSDTLRTWKWSPTRGGKCYPRWILQINREIENERKPQNPRFDLCFTMCFHIFTKNRIWSYGRYTHSGIRVRPKTRKKHMFAKKAISLENSSLKLKVWFFQKVRYDVKRFILSRYDMILNIYHIWNIWKAILKKVSNK